MSFFEPVCNSTFVVLSHNSRTPRFVHQLVAVLITDTVAASLTCTDIDASPNGDIASYTIVSGDDASAKFKTVGAVVKTTAVALDYETKISYTLLVDVVDGGATPRTGTATVLVLVMVHYLRR